MQKGFTLVELMITVTILAILSLIAYPSYDRFIRNTRLENVKGDLLDNAQRLELFYSQNRTFDRFNNLKNENKYFNISFDYNDGKNPNKTEPPVGHYLLTAVPNANTNANENRSMSLDDDGIIKVCSGTGANQDCEMY